MICVTVMLAVFLGWPLAFGTGGKPNVEAPAAQGRALVATHRAAAPGDQPRLIPAGFDALPVNDVHHPASCQSRYREARAACSADAGEAACRLRASDDWDLCEATGFWPE